MLHHVRSIAREVYGNRLKVVAGAAETGIYRCTAPMDSVFISLRRFSLPGIITDNVWFRQSCLNHLRFVPCRRQQTDFHETTMFPPMTLRAGMSEVSLGRKAYGITFG
jgi:hypothetical protein